MARKPAASKATSSPRQAPAKKTRELQAVQNPALSSVWVDSMQLVTRQEVDAVTLRFLTVMPEAAYEACRLQTSIAHARQMIDVMAAQLDHYPTRPEPKKKPVRKKGAKAK